MSFDSGGSVNLGSAHGDIIVSLDDAQRQINRQVGQLERGILSSFGRIGDNVQKMGIGLTKVLSPVTGFVIGGISAFAKFDDVLTEIEARTGATADEMESVRLTALQMGQDTAFSATQASDGMLQLLSSGFDLEQTFAALPAVLDLAAAGMLDMGFAGDAVTDILAQFNLTAEDSRMVADALAQASGSSSATITDLIQGFANVGPLAASMGLSIRETSASLAVLSENGIKGAEAGTALKAMFTNMTSTVPKVTEMWDSLGVSMFDSEGQMRNFDDIIDDLNMAMDGMSDKERIETVKTLGGSYGQLGLSALLTADGIDSMLDSMDRAATAADLGEARMKSFKGAVDLLKSSIETIMINMIGPLVEKYLQPLIETITTLLNTFNEWIMLNPELAEELGLLIGVLAILGPAVTILGAIITAVLSPIGLLVAALGFAFQRNLLGIRDALRPVIDGFRMYFRIIEMGGTRSEAFRLGIKKLRESFAESLADSPLLEFLGKLRDTFVNVQNIISFQWNNNIKPIFEQIIIIATKLAKPFGGLAKVIKFFAGTLIGILFPPLGLLMKMFTGIKLAMKVFAGGAKTAGKNMQKMFKGMVKSVGKFFSLLSEALSEAAVAFVQWIEDVAPEVITGIASMISSVVTWLRGAIPQLITALLGWGTAFLQWIGPMIREFLPKLGEFLGSAIEWILVTGSELTVALLQWAIDAAAMIPTALGDFLVALGNFIVNDLIPGVIGFAQGIGGGLLNGISQGLGSIVSFFWNDVIVPLVNAIPGFTSDVYNAMLVYGPKILNGIADGIVLIKEKIIDPIAAELKLWASAAYDAMLEYGPAILRGIADGIIFGFHWIWTNLISPLKEALAGNEDEIKSSVSNYGSSILLGIAEGLLEVGTMIKTNLIDPLALELQIGLESILGELGTKFLSILVGVGLALFAFSFVLSTVTTAWTTLKTAILAAKAAVLGFNLPIALLILAITAAIFFLDEFAKAMGFEGITDLLEDTFDTWKTNFENFGTIVSETVLSWQTNIENAITILGLVWDAFWTSVSGWAKTAIDNMIGWVGNLVSDIQDAITDALELIGLTGGGPGVIATTVANVVANAVGGAPGGSAAGSGSGGDRGVTQFGGNAEGTPWTGNGSRDRPAGFVHNREGVVPTGGMSVTPSPDGLQLHGMKELFASMMGRGTSGMMGQMIPAGGGAGGESTSINFNGDIQLALSEDILRDPEMVERAQQFGKSFMDGVLTNSEIMDRVRGQS